MDARKDQAAVNDFCEEQKGVLYGAGIAN